LVAVKWILLVHGIAAVFAAAWMIQAAIRGHRREQRAAEFLRLHSKVEGPPTLHPIIDTSICIGSGACVRSCPEDRALVLVNGKSHLAQAAGCVGHGDCVRACPVDAITLAFGTAQRGVDLPDVNASFESSRKGLYIAGELGGMGLIATAVRQGVKAVEAIHDSLRAGRDDETLPLLIVGAGPAGIAAMLEAHRLGMRARWIDKETSLGGSVLAYPRGKVVMTTPVELPIYGKVHLRRTTKAALIELWQDVLARCSIAPEYGTMVTGVVSDGDVLVVSTSGGPIRARRVLLATGRRGRPRQLQVAGEQLAHVHHHLDDPMQHDHARIVGGGDVAVEAALALAERPGTEVTLCHRGEQFDRAKPALQARLAEATGLTILRRAEIDAIREPEVIVRTPDGSRTVIADKVFVLIGTDLPSDLLAASGIRVQTHRGEPVARAS
jgi:thioredoxin reductase